MTYIFSPSFTKVSKEGGLSRGKQNSTCGHLGNSLDETNPIALLSSAHRSSRVSLLSPSFSATEVYIPESLWAHFIRWSWVTRPHITAREVGNCGLATCPKVILVKS